MTSKVEQLREIIQQVADERPDIFEKKGQERNIDTNGFMETVRERAMKCFGEDYSQYELCGDRSLKVDFFFPDEMTIVELTFGLRSEYFEHRLGMFKSLVAREQGCHVSRLVILGDPGDTQKSKELPTREVHRWALNQTGLKIEVYDIENRHESNWTNTD